MVNSSPNEEEVTLLHRRLGHPSFTLLKVMYPHLFKQLSMEKLVCDACQLAKSKREIYPSIDNRSLTRFHLVH